MSPGAKSCLERLTLQDCKALVDAPEYAGPSMLGVAQGPWTPSSPLKQRVTDEIVPSCAVDELALEGEVSTSV